MISRSPRAALASSFRRAPFRPGVFAGLLRRIVIFLFLAGSDPADLNGIRYNVSGALFAFRAFGHVFPPALRSQ
jgi:hypothetical protein